MKDLYNIIVAALAFTPTLVKVTTPGAAVNLVGYEGAKFDVYVGQLGDALSAADSFEFDVQESFDGGNTWTPSVDFPNIQYAVGVANGAANTGCGKLLAAGAANDPAQMFSIGYLGVAPMIRLNVVVKGVMANGTTIAAFAQLGFARHNPANITQVP